MSVVAIDGGENVIDVHVGLAWLHAALSSQVGMNAGMELMGGNRRRSGREKRPGRSGIGA